MSQAYSWDLAGNWGSTSANPNDSWGYGLVNAGVYSPLSYLGNNANGAEFGFNGTPYIYKPTMVSGITPGQVDLDASGQNPEVVWTAPFSMVVTITINVGGVIGNTQAQYAVLTVNGVQKTGSYNMLTNVQSWNLTDVSFVEHQQFSLMVPDPNGNPNPNTQTEIHVAFVTPEPAPFAALGVGALGLLLRRRRR